MKPPAPARLNQFTRWFLFSLLLLAVSVLLYFGRAIAQTAQPIYSPDGTVSTGPLKEDPNYWTPERLRNAKPMPMPHPPADTPPVGMPVTLLPDRIILPPQLSSGVVMTAYDVDTRIKDNVATTTVTQTYKNTSGQTLEARYLFPLPTDANFSSLTLTVNGKTLEGKILEKEEARNTYQEIVRKLIDPGLLEYLDDKTVQLSIAPFFAGESKEVRLSYTQVLKQDGGLYKYTYYLGNQMPGTINRPAPADFRCIRWPCHPAPPQPDPSSSPGLNLAIELKTTQTLKTIYSPSHDPKINRTDAHHAMAKLNIPPKAALTEKNFVLYFSQDNSAMTLNSLNYKKAGEDGYFLMTVRPPEAVKTEILPKDVVLVLDTSGSMGGDKIRQAKEALKAIINRLRPEDRFSLLQFNTDVSVFKNELTPASPANRQAALDYVENLEASGSTNIEMALKDGFAQLKNHDPKRPAYMIFLTDGEPTVGVTDTDGLVKIGKEANRYEGRLFNFGVGYNLNAVLLDKLSEGNHGSATYVEPNENLELAMTGFYKKIESPVLTDAELSFEGVQVSKLYPAKLGDLFAGSEVVLLGRYKGGPQGTAKLTGKMGGSTHTYVFPLRWSDSTSHGYLPRLWAGRRIAYLLDSIRQNGENAELKNEVIALSKQYGIITPYTSFLAQEPERQDRPGMGGGGNPPPAVMPMASQAAMDASSGQRAVQFSKQLDALKTQASAQAMNEAQDNLATTTVQTVNGKTFVLSKNIWTDTAYDAKTQGKPQTVAFGTDAYFKLLTDQPELAPYFSLGEQVIVVLNGKAYQVLPASPS